MQEIYDQSLARTSFTLVMLEIGAAMALVLVLTAAALLASYFLARHAAAVDPMEALKAE